MNPTTLTKLMQGIDKAIEVEKSHEAIVMAKAIKLLASTLLQEEKEPQSFDDWWYTQVLMPDGHYMTCKIAWDAAKKSNNA